MGGAYYVVSRKTGRFFSLLMLADGETVPSWTTAKSDAYQFDSSRDAAAFRDEYATPGCAFIMDDEGDEID